MSDLIIVGAGGAGIEALWTAQRLVVAGCKPSWEVIGFADDNPMLHGAIVEGVKIIGSSVQLMAAYAGQDVFFHCSIGHNAVRRRVAALWEQSGFTAATLIDPTALVAQSARIGVGSYVAAGVIVSARAVVGRHVLLNFGAMVGHDCVVGNFAQLCPGVRMNGACSAGAEAFLGANAAMAPGKKMGDGAVLGACSFATTDLAPGITALGVPARPIFTKKVD